MARPSSFPPSGWSSTNEWPGTGSFSTTNIDSPRWVRRAVGIGARQQHEQVGAPGERGPGLHAVDAVAAVDRRRAIVVMPATSEP